VAGALLLVVLAAAGFVIGQGSSGLSADPGIAQTSDLNAEWECSWTNDDGVTTDASFCGGLGAEPSADDGKDPYGSFPSFAYSDPFVEVDVGRCEAEIPPPVANPDGDLVATVTIGNAYPSYECTFTLVLSNTGSLPFSLVRGTTDVHPPLELLDGACAISGNELQEGDLATIKCTVHVMEEALQSHVYNFTISACAAPCDSSVAQRFGYLGWRRGLPASIGLSIASSVD
jgi:hypothetical protein